MDISRRELLKVSALVGGGGLVSALGFDLKPAYAQSRELKISNAREFKTICPYCAVGCGTIAYVHGSGGLNTVNFLGSRSLVCSLCATEWRFPRLTCAHCGETKADQLLAHTAESVAHVRVDECKSCSQYMKTVDLRKRGDAIPLVDELATVELDLWAQERGLTKMRVNVLGL